MGSIVNDLFINFLPSGLVLLNKSRFAHECCYKNNVFLAYKLAAGSIDITTVQNVTLSYETASVRQRILANIIDFVLVFLVFIFLRLFISIYTESMFFAALSMIAVWWVYHWVCILFFYGRTPGMALNGTKILFLDPAGSRRAALFLRWMLRPVDIGLTLGSVGILAMMSSDKNQRLGDFFAGTVVVLEKPKTGFTLREILVSHDEPATEIHYPQVRFIKEDDVLMLKNLIRRPSAYSTEMRNDLIAGAADKMAEMLGVTYEKGASEAFLKQLIADYILVTR